MELRPYQTSIIEQTRHHFRQGTRCVLIESPTGSGKTLLASTMLRTAAERGIPSVFTCHRRELIKQTHLAFEKMNIGHGIIGNGFHFSNRPMVQIASVQTIKNKLHQIRKPGLVIMDEVHHCPAKSWKKVYDAFPDAYIIGLTATPERLDGSGLNDFFPVMVKGPTVQNLIDNGYLSKYKLYAPANIDTSKFHTRMGDYVTAEVADAIDKPTITGDAIKEYQKYAAGKRAIVRGVSIEHSKHIAKQFTEAGIPAQHVDGTDSMMRRDMVMDSFRKGETLILSNVDLFSEGLDVPSVECVIDLRPTKSLTLALQFWGRVLRPAPGKEYAIIIDHAGNCQRHGLPCDEREWNLEGRVKKPKQDNGPAIRLCPRCFGANQNWRKSCQYCGNEFTAQPREVAKKEGDLVEIDVLRKRRERQRTQAMCRTFDELVEFATERGYKSPKWWAGMIIKAREKKNEGDDL